LDTEINQLVPHPFLDPADHDLRKSGDVIRGHLVSPGLSPLGSALEAVTPQVVNQFGVTVDASIMDYPFNPLKNNIIGAEILIVQLPRFLLGPTFFHPHPPQ
jgi:hypothetical protein